jgi:hypothetical protein
MKPLTLEGEQGPEEEAAHSLQAEETGGRDRHSHIVQTSSFFLGGWVTSLLPRVAYERLLSRELSPTALASLRRNSL